LNTTSNCSFCGEVCSGGDNICTASGCDDHLPVTVVGSKTLKGNGPNQATTYTLTSTSLTTRGLIVAAAAVHAGGLDISVEVSWSGGSSDMTLAHRESMLTAEAAIFYLKEAALPSPGTVVTVTVTSADTWGGLVASVIEVTDMYQAGDPVDDAGGTQTSVDCSPLAISRSAAVTVGDSLIVAVANAQGPGPGEGQSANGTNVTKIQDEYTVQQTYGLVGYRENATAATTVGFSSIDVCWDTALATATFRSWQP
jgi:hypothetical protein